MEPTCTTVQETTKLQCCYPGGVWSLAVSARFTTKLVWQQTDSDRVSCGQYQYVGHGALLNLL